MKRYIIGDKVCFVEDDKLFIEATPTSVDDLVDKKKITFTVKEKKHRGRQSNMTDEIFDDICDEIDDGATVEQACRNHHCSPGSYYLRKKKLKK